MHTLRNSPFLKLIVPLCVGIGLYLFLPLNSFYPALIFLVIFLVGYILFSFSQDVFRFKFPYLRGLLLSGIILTSGYLISYLFDAEHNPQFYLNQKGEFNFAEVLILSEPLEKEKTFKTEVEIKSFIHEHKKINVIGNAFVYFQKGEQVNSIHQGDIVLIKNNFQAIKSSGNPGAFDYAAYCKTKNIFESAYIRTNEWKPTSKKEFHLRMYFDQANAFTRSILSKFILDKEALGIAEALLIGYRNDIDNDTWQAYTNTGIVHIIAISGMHMAMVYGTIRWLLMLIPFFKRKKIVALLIAIAMMWVFAILTGMPASVVRAAVMFSFIGFGEIANRKMSVYNNLAASAFFLLCINPFWLLDVGFQLSYMAVVSIVVFYKLVYERLFFSNKFLNLTWQLIAGTIAAQILTLPMCLYYFHQFPILFLVTNLIAIPATTVILYLEIVLIFMAWLSPIALFLGKIVTTLILWLNQIVFWLGTLSFAVWQQIQISSLQMILMYVIIIALSLTYFKPNFKFLMLALSSILIFFLSISFEKYQILNQEKIIVYNANKSSAIEFIHANTHELFSSDSITPKTDQFIFKPARTILNLKKESKLSKSFNSENIDIFQYHHKTITRVKNTNFNVSNPLKIDYLILSGNFKVNPNWIQERFEPKQIILDSNVPFWKLDAIKAELSSLKIPIHTVNEDGAFVVEM